MLRGLNWGEPGVKRPVMLVQSRADEGQTMIKMVAPVGSALGVFVNCQSWDRSFCFLRVYESRLWVCIPRLSCPTGSLNKERKQLIYSCHKSLLFSYVPMIFLCWFLATCVSLYPAPRHPFPVSLIIYSLTPDLLAPSTGINFHLK